MRNNTIEHILCFRGKVTKRIQAASKAIGSDMRVWQHGYYERIVLNERELNAIRAYIRANPICWAEERENLDELLAKMRRVNFG